MMTTANNSSLQRIRLKEIEQYIKQYLKQYPKKAFLLLILSCYLAIKTVHLLNQKGIAWDSAVYIGMGKYIFTLGKAGLWEPSRPLVWPLLLGFLWKLRLNPIIFGEVLELLCGVGCICLTYLIGKRVFNEGIALLSSLFLAFSPTFLFHSSGILAGIPSTFFAMLAIYLLIKERYILSGLFLGLSSITRFLQSFILIPVFLVILLPQLLSNYLAGYQSPNCPSPPSAGCLSPGYLSSNKLSSNKKGVSDIFKRLRRLRKTASLSCGFLIILIPYLILNTFLYRNPLYPFLLQVFMTRYTGWVYHQPFFFYFAALLRENFLILFALPGIILAARKIKKIKKIKKGIRQKKSIKKKDLEKALILGVFLFFFIFFSSIAHKEVRFILVFLPYMYLAVSYGILKTFGLIGEGLIKRKKSRKKNLRCLVLIAVLTGIAGVGWAAQTTAQIRLPDYREYPEFTKFIAHMKTRLKTGEAGMPGPNGAKNRIWISNPVFIAYSDEKADELIYYPLYNSKKIDELEDRLEWKLPGDGNMLILLDTCDVLPCPPADKECGDKTIRFIGHLKEKFKTAYYKKDGGCEQFIFAEGIR